MEIYRVEHGEFHNGPYNTSAWDMQAICDCDYFIRRAAWYDSDMPACDWPEHEIHCPLLDLTEVTEALLNAHCDSAHPAPHRDEFLGKIEPYEMCGFESLQDLHEWFDGWAEELDSVGYVIRKFNVHEDAVRRGWNQVVFSGGQYDLTIIPLTGKVAS